MSHIVTMASSIPSLTSSACLRGGFLLLLGSFLHVLVQIGVHVRSLIRAVSGKVTLLLQSLHELSGGKEQFLAKCPSSLQRWHLSSAFGRPRSFSGLVSGCEHELAQWPFSPQRLHTSSAPGCFFSRLGPLSYPRLASSVTHSRRSVRIVHKFCTNRRYHPVSHHRTPSPATDKSARSVPTLRISCIGLPVALRLSGKVFPLPRSSRVRQRALTRPVTDLSASVASIGPPIRRHTASLRTVSRVMPRLSTIPTRIVRPRPRGVRGVRPSRTRIIVHPFAHVSPRAIRELGRRRRVARWRRIAIECRVFCPIPMRPEGGPPTAHVRASVRGIARGSSPKARASGRCERYRASSVTSSASCGRDARERREKRRMERTVVARARHFTSLGGGGGAQRALLRLAIGCAGCVGGVGVSRGLVTCATACVGAAAAHEMGRFQDAETAAVLADAALGVSLTLVHVYVKPIKDTMRALWAVGSLGVAWIALFGDAPLTEYVCAHRESMLAWAGRLPRSLDWRSRRECVTEKRRRARCFLPCPSCV